jgi:hypothetical protein
MNKQSFQLLRTSFQKQAKQKTKTTAKKKRANKNPNKAVILGNS